MRKILFVFLCIAVFACRDKQKNGENEGYEEKSGSVIIDGTTFEYLIKGKGIPFLLVGSDPAYFSDEFFQHFKVYSIETRLTTKISSPVDTATYNLDHLLREIDTVRSVLGIDKFMISGHSVMGAIAHKYAIKYPDFVSHVVMLGTPRTFGTNEYNSSVKTFWDSAPQERRSLYNEKQKQLEKEREKQLEPNEYFLKSLVASGPKRWYDANLDATELFKRIHYNLDFLSFMFTDVIPEYDLCTSEEAIDIPVFVAIGTSDYIGPPTLWETNCDDLSDLTISVFKESGHTPHYEQGELFSKRLVDWVGGN